MIKIAVCDDNSEELEVSRKIISEIFNEYKINFEICGFSSGEELLQTDLDFHLVFLDIVMDEKNGIAVGCEIYRRNRRIKVMFQTSFKEYCADAINKSHAFAFLEKPLTKEAVGVQLETYIENNIDLANPSVEFRNVMRIYGGESEFKTVVSLPIRNIMYFYYLKSQKRMKIVTGDSEYIYKAAMNVVEKRMKPFGFVLSCRGILVNLESIERIQGYEVFMKNGKSLTLSQKRVQTFREALVNYMHNSESGR